MNLLTRGFGYFYLGERTLGFVVFFGLMFFQAPLKASPGGGVVIEIILAVMGAHAYSIARQSEKQILASVRLPAEPAPSNGFPPAIPIGLAAVLAAGYLALVAVGLHLPDYSRVDQSRAHVVQDSAGVFYQNPEYEVTLRAPSQWTVKNDVPNYILLAVRSDHACSVTLQPIAWSPLVGLGSFKGQLADEHSKAKDLTGVILDDQPAVLSGLKGRDIRVSVRAGEQRIIEHHIIARKGMTLYDVSTDELARDEGRTNLCF